MLKLGIIFIACHLASGSVVPVVRERSRSEVPAVQERLDSPSPGFSPEQLNQLSGICFTVLRLMLDQTSPIQQSSPSSPGFSPEQLNQLSGICFTTLKLMLNQTSIQQRINSAQPLKKEEVSPRKIIPEGCPQMATIQDEEELSKNLQAESYWQELNYLASTDIFASWSFGPGKESQPEVIGTA